MVRRDEDDDLFRAAMAAEGVRPMREGPGRVAVVPRSGGMGRARRESVSGRTASRVAGNAGAFVDADDVSGAAGLLHLEREGESASARADGVDKRTLRKLARGETPIAGRLDLHGEIGRVAEERTLRFVRAAREAGHQAVAIVHGRGLHSGREGPVLRDLVLLALTEGAARDHVLALASAPPQLGGPGVTLVLLRRKR